MQENQPFPTSTRYGRAHPERVENALWEQAIREGWTGYALAQHLGPKASGGRARQDFSLSRVVFPVTRLREGEPELGIAFDLVAQTWSQPFPHPHPAVQLM